MITVNCAWCEKPFSLYPSVFAAGRRCCSKSCARRHQYRDRRPPIACGTCGGMFRPPATTSVYCSVICRQRGNSRKGAAARGDAFRDRGDGKTYRKRDGRHEHRVVAEQMLGRALLPGEVVHHKNHDKRDNRPENLEVLPSQADHARHHWLGERNPRWRSRS